MEIKLKALSAYQQMEYHYADCKKCADHPLACDKFTKMWSKAIELRKDALSTK